MRRSSWLLAVAFVLGCSDPPVAPPNPVVAPNPVVLPNPVAPEPVAVPAAPVEPAPPSPLTLWLESEPAATVTGLGAEPAHTPVRAIESSGVAAIVVTTEAGGTIEVDVHEGGRVHARVRPDERDTLLEPLPDGVIADPSRDLMVAPLRGPAGRRAWTRCTEQLPAGSPQVRWTLSIHVAPTGRAREAVVREPDGLAPESAGAIAECLIDAVMEMRWEPEMRFIATYPVVMSASE